MAYRFGLAALRDFASFSPLEGVLDSSSDIAAPRSGRAVVQWLDGAANDWTAATHQPALATPTLSIVPDGGELTMTLRCGCPSCMKSVSGFSEGATAFEPDGVGVLRPTPPATPSTLITVDMQPADTSTTATLVVGGPSIISTIDTIGDQDFFRINLVEGQSYEIGMYLKAGGPNLVPLADCYVEIYDAAGNLIVSADGGGPNTPSGLDVLMTFTAEYTGTYFVNARAFDNVPDDGTDGDIVGDYELFARETDGFSYQPHYSPDSPLYAIDWGSQVDGSSRNPDGQEGPRVTGNDFTGVGSNPYGIVGKNVITYYLAKAGDVFIDEDPTTPGTTDTMVAKGWSDWEENALNLAFDAYENVADIIYVEVDNRAEADFVFVTYNGTPGPGVSLLGRMSPPDEENEGRGEFNALDERWTEEGLAPGGFTFTTLIHEMGHGHGLAHPHDNGGRSGVMRGVESDGPAFDYTNGDFDLNQSIYTMMSYEDGWQKSPYGQAETTDPFGWLGSLMAFDVAAIQDKYGVNEDYATGDDSYVIDDENVAGTFYSCIWDAGGTDEIVYMGARDATIDLRAATLQYEYGGGGWLSYAYGIYGGYTIANGVTIENATGGDGNDTITGNAAANVLRGGLGDDTVSGGDGDDRLEDVDGGADTLNGDAGNDTLVARRTGGATGDLTLNGGDGDDVFMLEVRDGAVTALGGEGADTFDVLAGAIIGGGAGRDLIRVADAFSGALRVLDFQVGDSGDQIDLSAFLSSLVGLGDLNPFDAGYLRLSASGDDTLLEVNVDGPGADWATMIIFDDVAPAGFTAANFLGLPPPGLTLTGGSSADTLTGGEGADVINGGGGDDRLSGLGGSDRLIGGSGKDRLDGGDGNDSLDGGSGDDQLLGGGGDDQLSGGVGRDWINGGAGADTLTGGDGVDTFVFQTLSDSTAAGPDIILDFGSDRIDLRGIDADVNAAGDQAFKFVSQFSGATRQAVLSFDDDADVTTLQLDVNGDGVADFTLLINGDATTASSSAWLL